MTDREFLNRILNDCRQERLFQPGSRCIVGVSGGADSVCLLRVLFELKDELQVEPVVVHVHHGLRETADSDERFVQELCAKWQIPCHVCRCDVARIAQEEKLTVEEAGRNERYRVFEEIRCRENADVIALAHHMDDQAETILWNLVRGSGVKGLCGMRAKRGRIVRPLLNVTKEQILEFLGAREIPYCTDETNADDRYTRNRLRNQILPLIEETCNAQAKAHIAGAGRIIGQMEAYIREQAEEAMKQCVTREEDALVIQKDAYDGQAAVIRDEILRLALAEVAGTRKDLGLVHVEALKSLMENQTGRSADLPYGITAYREYEGLRLRKASGTKDTAKTPFADRINMRIIELDETDDREPYTRENRYTKWFDYDIIKGNLSIRTRQPKDRITIDEHGGTKLLSDYLINEKVPREERDRIPLVAVDHEILWVVGYRTGMSCQVSAKTARILEVTYKE